MTEILIAMLAGFVCGCACTYLFGRKIAQKAVSELDRVRRAL
jgi:membrane protein DedA with SNARE-associated domain